MKGKIVDALHGEGIQLTKRIPVGKSIGVRLSSNGKNFATALTDKADDLIRLHFRRDLDRLDISVEGVPEREVAKIIRFPAI